MRRSREISPEFWGRLKPIFDRASEEVGPKRSALLDSLCGDDAELRREVDSLLASHDATLDAGGFLTVPDTPARIGPYRIVRQIAKGGIGIVYLAEQSEPLHRTVAVKLIQIGMDTQESVARFELERQSLALMNHPNIAQVFDAGATEAGRLYFAMEYVPGVPITEYCDRHRVDLRGRLQLFLQICDAIQHAHQKGIVHRDIKPTNILTMTRGTRMVPKVIDFGVALATSGPLRGVNSRTQAGSIVGTPRYLSPEQASRTEEGIDTRTDVYSLGVLLYELLTGLLPFGGSKEGDTPLGEILHRVLKEEPQRPSSRVSSAGRTAEELAAVRATDARALCLTLRGDLDCIVLRTLEKRPEDRYGSAAELAADIERYLDDRAIHARPPSSAYRTKKFVQRHRIGVSLAATAVLALIASTILFGFQASRIALERDRAELEAGAARAVTDFLVDLFRDSDPGERPGGRELTAETLLADGVQRLDGTLAHQPEVRARLMAALGKAQRGLSNYPAAEALTVDALRIQEETLGSDHPDVGATAGALADLYNEMGRYEEAERLGRRAVAILEQNEGVDGRRLSAALRTLAHTLREQEKFGEALQLMERRKLAIEANPRASRRELAGALDDLATLHLERRDAAKGEPYIRRAVELLRQQLPPGHPHLLDVEGRLANNLSTQGRNAEAAEIRTQNLVDLIAAYGEKHNRVGFALYNLGVMRARLGETETAIDLLQRSKTVWTDLFGPDHENVAYSHRMLGSIFLERGELAVAEAELRRAMQIDELVFGRQHRNFAISSGRLGQVLVRNGRANEARPLLQTQIEYFRHAADDPSASAGSKLDFARSLLEVELNDLQDPVTALVYAEQVVAMAGVEAPEASELAARARTRKGDSP